MKHEKAPGARSSAFPAVSASLHNSLLARGSWRVGGTARSRKPAVQRARVRRKSGLKKTWHEARLGMKPLDQPHGNAVAAPERLRRRADFLRAAKGMRFFARGLTLQAAPRPIPSETIEARPPGDPTTFGAATGPAQTGIATEVFQPRFGFTVTKQSGGAVRRNRIRRRLKEALRLLDPLPARPGHDYVILARPEAQSMPFLDLQEELIRALGKIAARKNQPPIRRDNDREGRAAGDADEARRQSSKGRKPKG
jgi:ribonuclease P protein component